MLRVNPCLPAGRLSKSMLSSWGVEGLTFHKNPFNMAKIHLIKDVVSGCGM
jgi:hypothetical protein